MKLKYKSRTIELNKIKQAQIKQESGGNQYATRYEPAFQKRYIDNNAEYSGEPETVRRALATSYGLFQIMGVKLREMGYKGTFEHYLNDRDVQNFYYEKYCRKYLKKYTNNLPDFLAAYNAGRPIKRNGKYINQGYVDRVLRYAGLKTSIVGGAAVAVALLALTTLKYKFF